MSTESGKTCVECFEIFTRTCAHVDQLECERGCWNRIVKLCPLHNGSMAEKFAEALREMITHHDRGYGPLTRGMRNRFDTMLAAYDELQGRKG